MADRWDWSCRYCGKSGPYQGSDYQYPKGWRFHLRHGLVCSKCAKRHNIKTSDVEKEPKPKTKTKIENPWDVL